MSGLGLKTEEFTNALTRIRFSFFVLCINALKELIIDVLINIVLMNYNDERSNRRMPCHRGVVNDYAS